jgi:Hemerythrin HHE cation binding domain
VAIDETGQSKRPPAATGGDAVEVLEGEHDRLQELFARVSSPDEDRPAVLKELMQTLANHLDLEKQLLFPALKDVVDDGSVMADRLSVEHGRAEHILTLLERRKVNSPDVPELVTELLDITDDHVAFSAMWVFPALRQALTPAQLEDLGARMVSGDRRLLTHSHPLLPDSGPISAVTRKVAEVVDRVRDHSTDIGRTTG